MRYHRQGSHRREGRLGHRGLARGEKKAMRIAIIGQQKFGKSVLEAFSDRGDTVAGVFCAPEMPGTAPDPLRLAAEQREIRLFQLPSLKAVEAQHTLRD